MNSVANVVGLLGVVGILSAYVLLQSERLRAEQPMYSLLNALGSGAILFSLIFDFNLSAALVEGMWMVISFYGLYRSLKKYRRGTEWSAARVPPEVE